MGGYRKAHELSSAARQVARSIDDGFRTKKGDALENPFLPQIIMNPRERYSQHVEKLNEAGITRGH